MSRPRRFSIRRPDPGAAGGPLSTPWLFVILINLFGKAVRYAATEWDGDVAWLDVLVAVAVVGLVVTIGLALRAVSRRRARPPTEPGPPWLSPMYDPWLDG